MNKSLKKAVSLVAALTMAVSAIPAIGASAKSNDVYTSSYTWYNAKTELYYDSKDEAAAASAISDVYNGYAINNDYHVNFSPAYPYYSSYTKKYYPSFFAANAVSKGNESMIIFGGPDGSPVYDSKHIYYSSYTKRYYETYEEALKHSANTASYIIKADGTVSYTTGTVYAYYSTYTNKYYTTYTDALAASKGYTSYVKAVYNYTVDKGSGDYYNSKTGKWYTSLSSALAAGSNNADYVYYTGSSFTVYYNSFTRRYYASVSEALAAGGEESDITQYNYSGRDIPAEAYRSTVVYNAPYYDGYYYNGYYYNYPYYYYGYYAYPYYYYYNKTSETTAGEGVPYLKGYTTRHSWSNLATYVKNVKSGSTVQITMNGATTVPDTFMSALKGRNVTVVFNMDNGVAWTVKGTSVTEAKTVNLSVSYDADVIPDKLLKKATKDAIAAAEVSVGTADGSSLGFKGSCTIKFNSSRANEFAKTYCYNKEDNNLTLVSKSMTNDNGYVSFVASENGTYLVVLS
ncbi:MAG: hypothetical protein ACI4XF_12510 [Oscillospiraceae bacterium]